MSHHQPPATATPDGGAWMQGPTDLIDLIGAPDRADVETVNLFAGPGGWEEGARILGLDLNIEGIEISADACATARTAGHRRRNVDVRHVHPNEYPNATGLIVSPPCPSFSVAGTHSDRDGRDKQLVRDIWTGIGWGIDPLDALEDVQHIKDPRTALLTVAGVWAMTMPNLDWLVMEEVPVVHEAFIDLSAELSSMGWEFFNVHDFDATEFGVPSHRKRTFLVGNRVRPGYGVEGASRATGPTMAQALRWPEGHTMVTRGDRAAGGGNKFSADSASWCLTGRARSWQRDDGLRLTAAQAGYLSGFRPDYPWTGSRSSQFQQAGDVVSPLVAATVIGDALHVPAAAHLAAERTRLYGPSDAYAARLTPKRAAVLGPYASLSLDHAAPGVSA
ncbi:DNA cytosine methyltransferase [Sanguibacter hominis ATCC BAA-789]|uniref:DNA cytosine methyltransferase n=1 Tax=Sanguibacter hominis ATCC BAA-789 TaxID=1312740 RepID=A0A9X5FD88_9MICO|nr:DNA cytosine methyltransferase [Sanguibacter hominis]NKX94275.1 DNA cytosine methyltransferase [Sanguibacter hominis ATCC BAA-789]